MTTFASFQHTYLPKDAWDWETEVLCLREWKTWPLIHEGQLFTCFMVFKILLIIYLTETWYWACIMYVFLNITSFKPRKNPKQWVPLLFGICRWGKRGTKRSSELTRVTGGKLGDRFWTQTDRHQGHAINHYAMQPFLMPNYSFLSTALLTQLYLFQGNLD